MRAGYREAALRLRSRRARFAGASRGLAPTARDLAPHRVARNPALHQASPKDGSARFCKTRRRKWPRSSVVQGLRTFKREAASRRDAATCGNDTKPRGYTEDRVNKPSTPAIRGQIQRPKLQNLARSQNSPTQGATLGRKSELEKLPARKRTMGRPSSGRPIVAARRKLLSRRRGYKAGRPVAY